MRISDWSSDVCSSDLESSASGAEALEQMARSRIRHERSCREDWQAFPGDQATPHGCRLANRRDRNQQVLAHKMANASGDFSFRSCSVAPRRTRPSSFIHGQAQATASIRWVGKLILLSEKRE